MNIQPDVFEISDYYTSHFFFLFFRWLFCGLVFSPIMTGRVFHENECYYHFNLKMETGFLGPNL